MIAAITSFCATTWAQNYTITEGKEDGLTNFTDVSNKIGENDKCYFICNREGKKDDTKYIKNEVKYIILRPDCKLYTKWDDAGSLLF